MPQPQLIQSIRDADLTAFLEQIGSLSDNELNKHITILYANWFSGIGFNLLQLVSMVRPAYARHLLERNVQIDLYSACALGDIQTIQSILDNQPNAITKNINGFYPIQFATRQVESLKLLLENCDDPNRSITKLAWYEWEEEAARMEYASYTPIHMVAVGRGGIDSAKCLQAFGADLNRQSKPFGESPIHLAATYGKTTLIQWFVENGCDVDTLSAARNSKLKIGELFEEKYFEPFNTSFHKTPLMLACGEGQLEAAKTLLNLGANPNAKDSEGFTPLHYASGAFWEENIKSIELLLAAGANKEAHSMQGHLPLDLAKRKNYKGISSALEEG